MAALGATIKVGIDSSAVRRGLAGIGRMVRGLGTRIGRMLQSRIGKVAAFVGAFALGRAALGVAELGSELSDMSVQTGVSVEKLVEMMEALRLAGVPMRDTSRMISLLASNIQEASAQAGPVRDAFHDLGFIMGDFENLRIDQAFDLIIRRIGEAGDEIRFLERDMEFIFGARIGFGLLRLAKDLQDNADRAAKTSRSFAKTMGEHATALDRAWDAIGRIGLLLKEAIALAMVQLPLERISDAIENFQLQDFLANLRNTFIWLRESFVGWAKEIGENIAEGFLSKVRGRSLLRNLLSDVSGFTQPTAQFG